MNNVITISIESSKIKYEYYSRKEGKAIARYAAFPKNDKVSLGNITHFYVSELVQKGTLVVPIIKGKFKDFTEYDLNTLLGVCLLKGGQSYSNNYLNRFETNQYKYLMLGYNDKAISRFKELYNKGNPNKGLPSKSKEVKKMYNIYKQIKGGG